MDELTDVCVWGKVANSCQSIQYVSLLPDYMYVTNYLG